LGATCAKGALAETRFGNFLSRTAVAASSLKKALN
jgi:hypothetical protein